jgi:serine/threonine protein kinase
MTHIIREATGSGTIINIPSQLGRYSYVRTFDRSTNSVLVAVQDSSGHPFCAKFVDRSFLVQHDQLGLFERELRLLAQIRNPHIVAMREIVYLPATIAIIMEYCEKGDLFHYIRHQGPLPPNTIRSFLFQIMKGLEGLHQHGCAHRDLKPENIVIGADLSVKLCDLGLAGVSRPDGLMSTMCGTFPYTPPEIIAGLQYDGAKADVWSLGIVAFVMATFKLPWTMPDDAGISRQILAGQLTFPSEFPAEVIPFIRKCTRVNPANRPTVKELLQSPWFAEEVLIYNQKSVIAALLLSRGSVPKASVKMIVWKPSARTTCNQKRFLKCPMDCLTARL